MIVLILDKNNSVIQSMNRATIFSIKNYFNINKDSETAIMIDREKEIEGDIIIDTDKILVGLYTSSLIEKKRSGIFDVDLYVNMPSSDISYYKIIENLIHVYDGKSLESIPHPMPYEEQYMDVETKFETIEVILDFKKYSRQELSKM